MKTKIVLLAALVMVGSACFGQNVGQMFNEANTELGQSFGTFKSILNWIGLFLLGGGILMAAYAYLYDQSKMRTATIAIIAAVLIFGIGGAMGLVG